MSDKMKAALVFAALLISAVAEPNGGFRCPKYWTEFNGHCYRFFSKPRLNFDNSQAYCQTFSLDPVGCSCRKANLVTIDSSEENSFILEWWQSVRGQADNEDLRIGYTDRGSEGRWRWVSGSTSSYTNWYRGQPDNYEQREHCAQLIKRTYTDAGAWNDESCGNSRSFICEY